MEVIIKIIKKIKEGLLQEILKETVWIYKLIKKYLIQIIIYTVLSLISVGITMFITVKMGKIVDSLVESDVQAIIKAGAFYVVFGCLNVVVTMITQRVSCTINLKVKKEVRIEVFEKIMKSDWESLCKHHSGDLLSRINEDVNSVSESIIGWVPTFIIQLTQLIITLTMIVYYDSSMILILLICLPFIIIGSRLFLPKMYKANEEMREVASEVMSFDKDSFQNIQSIKGFGIADLFSLKMIKLQEKFINVNLKHNKYSILSGGIMYVTGQLAAMLCLGWTIYHVHIGKITIGTMALFIMLAGYVSTSFKALTDLIPKVISTVTSSSRLRNLMVLPDEKIIDENKCSKVHEESLKVGATVEINNLVFEYKDGKRVFDNVSIYAKAGEIIALVGPSGEGKTTMLRILLGLVNSNSGNNIIYPSNNKEESIKISSGTRRFIAYVPQGNTIMAGTIAENMRLIKPKATDEEIINALKKACAYDFISLLPGGINHKIGESGNGFSEGQNQRLSIARALLSNAPILLLDEATSALDVVTERKILNNIMTKSKIHSCILTTHRPSVLSLCDRVYKIENKKINVINEEGISLLVKDF